MASATVVPKTKKVVKEDAAHPPYQDMVKLAIESLKERSGSSKQAILKYITGTFGISQDKKVIAHIRTALVRGVSSGVLKQVTGTGATGSFKLNKDKVAAPKNPAVAPQKKDDASSMKKADAASKKKADASSMKKADAASKKKADAASMKKADAASKKKADAASMKKSNSGKKAVKVASTGSPKAAPKPKKLTAGNVKTAKETKPTSAKKTAAAKKVTASKTKAAK